MEGTYQRGDLGKSVEILIDSQTSGKFFIKLIDTKTKHITMYFYFILVILLVSFSLPVL